MRRFFDTDFATLNINLALPEVLAEKPVDEPLYADIIGDAGDNVLIGTVGSDTINGLGGNDTLNGLRGTNTLTGGTGIDTFVVSGRGSHYTTITDFEDGIDQIDLSGMRISSFDQLVPHLSQTGSAVKLLTLWAAHETLLIENITLADLNAADFVFDTSTAARAISGLSTQSTLFGGLGDDIINGGDRDETIHGGDGNDYITAGLGSNNLYGGQGIDTFAVIERGASHINLWDFEIGVEVIDLSAIGISSFGQLSDYMYQANMYTTIVSYWAGDNEALNIRDIMVSDLSADDFVFDTDMTARNIMGTSSYNTLFGGLGDDIINGGSGREDLHGGDGDDYITGGGGRNDVHGGEGIDTFAVIERGSHRTYLQDFEQGVDIIDFSSIGISSFDQLLSYMSQDGTDVKIETYWHGIEQFYINDIMLSDLSATDFVFDTDITARNITGSQYSRPTFFGGLGDDIITGGSGSEDLHGGDGNDTITGGYGNDVLRGGIGDDILDGDAGSDTFIGGGGADAMDGGDGLDTVDYRDAAAGVAFDVLIGGTVGEALGDTFTGIERYYGSIFNDTITGSDANEFFHGEGGNDTINAGGGIDRVYGGDGNDIQRGQGGNDTLYGSAGSDQLNGGTGFDVANYSLANAAVIVNMLTGGTGGDADGDSYFGVEAIYGSDFDDSLTGNNSANELRGGDGNDMLFGLGGNDRFFSSQGADSFDGGTGIDIVNYTAANFLGVTLSLATGGTYGYARNDSYTSIEWVFGSRFSDNITGDNANNRLEGRDGNDTLNGAGGNDRLLGGDGNDIINGGDGVDTIFGQAGDDIMSGGGGNDFFFGDEGSDSHDGGTGTDTVSYLASTSGVTVNLLSGGTVGDAAGDTYTNIERAFGSSFDDSLTGSDGDNILLGNGGSDYLTGGAGQDTLLGGAGIDSFGYDATADGNDFISDFFGGETIFILGGDAAFDSFAELQAVATDVGSNVRFDFGGGNALTIIGRNIADMDADDFDFGGTAPAAPAPAGQSSADMDAFAADMVDVFDVDALI